MSTIFDRHDPRDIGAYAIAEASHYLGLPRATLRSWVRGRPYATGGAKKFSKPLIELPDPAEPLLSFTNLVEAHVLAAIRRTHGVPMQQVRPALEYLERQLGFSHPLAHQQLLTNGVHLFLEHVGRLLNLSQAGQMAAEELLRAHLKRVDHDTAGLASRLYPFSRAKSDLDPPRIVVLDPRVGFGRPVITGTSVRTEVIANRFKAGESASDLAGDYRLPPEQVEEAIRYELAA